MKTSELIDITLNYAVTIAQGIQIGEPTDRSFASEFALMHDSGDLHWSTDWSQGGLIIERESISVIHDECAEEHWVAQTDQDIYGDGPTPLIAAMRCFVASRLGDEVEIPEKLL